MPRLGSPLLPWHVAGLAVPIAALSRLSASLADSVAKSQRLLARQTELIEQLEHRHERLFDAAVGLVTPRRPHLDGFPNPAGDQRHM